MLLIFKNVHFNCLFGATVHGFPHRLFSKQQTKRMRINEKINWLKETIHDDGFRLHESLEDLPCHVHINSEEDFSLRFLNSTARALFNISKDDITNKSIDLLKDKVHPDDLDNAIRICQHYLQHRETLSSICYVQRILLSTGEYAPFFTTSVSVPQYGLVSFTVQLSNIVLNGKSIESIIYETHFIQDNYKSYSTLTPREKELITSLSSGNSIKEISQDMGITFETVKSYRKRIYSKLGINEYYQLFSFANAFGLVQFS